MNMRTLFAGWVARYTSVSLLRHTVVAPAWPSEAMTISFHFSHVRFMILDAELEWIWECCSEDEFEEIAPALVDQSGVIPLMDFQSLWSHSWLGRWRCQRWGARSRRWRGTCLLACCLGTGNSAGWWRECQTRWKTLPDQTWLGLQR